jgi:hypothetical protein
VESQEKKILESYFREFSVKGGIIIGSLKKVLHFLPVYWEGY